MVKADAVSAADWDALRADRFTFRYRDGREIVTSYRRAPSEVHDDPAAMRRYGAMGLAAGLRKAG